MPRFAGAASGTVLDAQNALVASTLPKLSREVADQVFKDLPFFFWIRHKNKVMPWSGGESIEIPLMYGKNEYAGPYDDYELVDTGPPSGFGNAVFIRAKYRVPIMYAATTFSANSGREQIYNLINKLKTQATKSLEDVINDDLMREDTVNDGETKRITGLNYVIEALAGASQDNYVGGIDKNSYSWWRNKFKDGTSSTSDGVASLLRENVIDCTDGNSSPDLGLMDSDSFLALETELYDKRRFVNAAAADFGFDNIVYNNVTYMYDKNIDDWVSNPSVADGYTFHINSDHLYIAVCTDRNFQVIAPEYDFNQDCYLGGIITHLQLICDKMSAHGVVTGTCSAN
jgi:hypothetical protein